MMFSSFDHVRVPESEIKMRKEWTVTRCVGCNSAASMLQHDSPAGPIGNFLPVSDFHHSATTDPRVARRRIASSRRDSAGSNPAKTGESRMLSKKMPGMLVIAGTMIAASLTVAPSAWSASPSSSLSHAEYKPVQSISYDFGSKSMSGYYVQEANSCLVMLMITASDPELAIETSPTRVRLALTPGQIAGLDSQEGRSLNVTCGADAATLIVDTGATERLFARQMPNSQRDLAERD